MRRLLVAALVLPIAGGTGILARAVQSQAVSGSNPAAQAKLHAGQAVLQHACMQCHAVIEGQYSFGPNLYGEMKKPHPRKTAAEVTQIVKNGKGKMPGFGGNLAAPDLDNLLAYLNTL